MQNNMDATLTSMIPARSLSWIREESERIGEESERIGEESEQIGEESEQIREESEQIREESEQIREESEKSGPLAPPTENHPGEESPSDGPEKNCSLLEELIHIEAELRESLRLDVQRQRGSEFIRQQQHKELQQNQKELSLSQRIGRPWVNSYFRKFPMHIYCLPIQAVNLRDRRRGLKKNQ